ncbi:MULTISPECIES: DUF1120 domain-containing protein [Providencia]|uniref:DUF1120 domain-containing protein n=1 Tax=Providencia TaxID=586 RepID=UPI0003E1D619|nr:MULTISPECIES: DUF1120 domain-containing protein [Providencia]ETS99353.1 PF06551 family protein [Providencia alcalifaciens PAL-3]EUC99861.1 PF06551 family protein [Providencia alcalifaciens PAL-1]MTB44452.1 DUF1120 domain-containing protein [Providencia sp. wls1950]MTC25042.1 DUF1120 domain-containing protein [Providencia sp. wls1938]MTC44369.1 DUF1120 domain-containing protein [Providencia sp. wls1922]
MRLLIVPVTKAIVLLVLGCLFCNKIAYSQTIQNENFIGQIKSPPTCEVIIPNGGEYRFNQLHARQFDLNKTTEIPELSKIWQISCNTPTLLLVQFSDNRSETSQMGNDSYFGLGKVNNQGRLGNYQLILSQLKVDGQAVGVGVVNGTELLPSTQESIVLKSKQYAWVTNENVISNGSHFAVNIAVKPILNSLKETNGPIVEAVELDGSANIIFSFGI